MLDRSSLTANNQRLEIEVSNLLEELKLTKDAAGDSGQALGQLQKSLKLAQENVIKSDDKAREANETLETRTSKFLKEKADLK